MSLNSFIPELWAAQILRNLHRQHVFSQPSVCNRDYQGDINERGDTVRITAIGAVTVSDYTKDTDMAAPQALADAQQTLVIEKAKYFNIAIDDIDMAQGNPKVMAEATYEAAYGLSDARDQYVAGLYTYAASGNFIGTDASPKTLSVASDLYPLITQCAAVLDQANVPQDGRYMILPPWARAVMTQDNRFVLNYNPGTFGTLFNGQIGQASGFNLLISNNVTNDGAGPPADYRIMFGHPMGITFADSINKIEPYRPPYRFADALKGLDLYGAKVVRPQALGVLTVTRNLA